MTKIYYQGLHRVTGSDRRHAARAHHPAVRDSRLLAARRRLGRQWAARRLLWRGSIRQHQRNASVERLQRSPDRLCDCR